MVLSASCTTGVVLVPDLCTGKDMLAQPQSYMMQEEPYTYAHGGIYIVHIHVHGYCAATTKYAQTCLYK